MEGGGAERPQPSHCVGLCRRGQVIFHSWIMPLSVVKKIEFTRDAAGSGLGKLLSFLC